MPNGKHVDRLYSGVTNSVQRGFTYLAVLAALALLAVACSAVLTFVAHQVRRERENDLLVVGQDIVYAIAQYYAASPGSTRSLPASLEDLLDDKRQIAITRYLREVYPDPTTGKSDWQLLLDDQGRVRGVASRNSAAPLRSGPVEVRTWTFTPMHARGELVQMNLSSLPAAKHYSEWRFEFKVSDDIASNQSPQGSP